MQTVTTVGLDIAKSVFQVHGVDAEGKVVIRRQLRRRHVVGFFQRRPASLVGIEACATSHHWSRELQALRHTVRLMPPAYVKPCVKRQKNDAADAEAICEAVTRANMRFVATGCCRVALPTCSAGEWREWLRRAAGSPGAACTEGIRSKARSNPFKIDSDDEWRDGITRITTVPRALTHGASPLRSSSGTAVIIALGQGRNPSNLGSLRGSDVSR
jgi:hypothetical protein